MRRLALRATARLAAAAAGTALVTFHAQALAGSPLDVFILDCMSELPAPEEAQLPVSDPLPCLRTFLESCDDAATVCARAKSLAARSIETTVPILRAGAGEGGVVSLSRLEVASLIARAFCLQINDRHHVSKPAHAPEGLNRFSFLELFSQTPEPYLVAKLSMFANYLGYFDAACVARLESAQGGARIRVTRRHLGLAERTSIIQQLEGQVATGPIALSSLTMCAGSMHDSDEYCTTDFANPLPGAGVLSTGKLQEPILFATRPELLLTSLVLERLGDSEAAVVENAATFSRHSGYGKSLRDGGRADPDASPAKPIILIDALDFREFPDAAYQYSADAMTRELLKATAGFGCGVAKDLPIGTGNWGCGAFGGDPQLKFVLQWTAASLAHRELRYFSFGEPALAGADELVSALRASNVSAEQLWAATHRWAAHRTCAMREADRDAEPGGLFQYLLTDLVAGK